MESVTEQLERMLRGARDVGRGPVRAGAALPADIGVLLTTLLPMPEARASFERMSEGAKQYVTSLLGEPEESELAQTFGELLGPPMKAGMKLAGMTGLIGGSRSANPKKLVDFLKGHRSGRTRDDLWRETEMFNTNNPARIGPEGAVMPGHVLSTEGSSVVLPGKGQTVAADQALKNAPNVFKNYPELSGVPVKGYESKDSVLGYMRPGANGVPAEIGMNLYNKNAPRFDTTLHHELGHGVQGIEGMPAGGNYGLTQPAAVESAKIIPAKMADLQRAYLARALADATYGDKAVDNRLVNLVQLNDRVKQVYGGRNLSAPQQKMLMKNNPEQLQEHITNVKNLSDLMPPSGFHNYDYLNGEVMSRLAEVYAGKSPEWIKQNPPWTLMDKIDVKDPSRIYNKAWFDRAKIEDIGLK